MSEAPAVIGAASGAASSDRVVLARSDHSLRLVNALNHARQALNAEPAQDFTATLSDRLDESEEKTADVNPAADRATADKPRLDFLRTSILRGHVSQPGGFNPDPNALPPLPDLPGEHDAAQGPAPDVARADEIAALSAMLDADRMGRSLPSVDALARFEMNLLPPDVLRDLHQRHLDRTLQTSAANGWPAPP
ncbi:hypothetical protein [Saliniramus sp.]|uniref:hypothetical protein n=1 Tax=Saliniramus sp. TaxID=2986772 RepID=UPI002B6B8525|nr:hypothetical protein [Saliniramus sp.]HMB12135.1 hypothetical protein [Saliniramus sp.]